MNSIAQSIIVALAMIGSASAGMMNIQLTGMDLTYDGSALTTQVSPDALTSVVITDAGGTPTVFATGTNIDLHIPGVTLPVGTPVSSATSAAGGVLTLNVPGGSLQLSLDSAVITHSDLGFVEFTFGAAETSIVSQSIPGGTLCDSVTFSFSQTINAGTQTDDGVNLTGFTSFGTGEITAVPEPALAGLPTMATAALLAFRRHRWAPR